MDLPVTAVPTDRLSRTRRVTARISALLRSIAPIFALVLTNMVCFGVQLATGGPKGFFTRDGGLAESAVDGGQWWRMFSSGFLHMDWMHLVGNMIALVVLGLWLVKRIGTERTLWAYAVGLLAASWGSMLFQSNAFTVGASGAIFGLAGTLFVIGIRQRTPVAVVLVGLWIVQSVYMTFSVEGIAWGAHLGGLVGGMTIGAALVADGERVVRSIAVTRLVGFALLITCFLGALQLA